MRQLVFDGGKPQQFSMHSFHVFLIKVYCKEQYFINKHKRLCITILNEFNKSKDYQGY